MWSAFSRQMNKVVFAARATSHFETLVAQPWSAIGLYSSDASFRTPTLAGEPTVTLTTSPRPASVPQPLVLVPKAGITFNVRTDIGWYDDPSDGLGAADSNGNTRSNADSNPDSIADAHTDSSSHNVAAY